MTPATPACSKRHMWDLQEQREVAYVDMELSSSEKDAGNTAFKEARYPEAVAHYQEALRRGPPSVNPEAHKLYSNLAACYQKLGAYPEGLKAADRCGVGADTWKEGAHLHGLVTEQAPHNTWEEGAHLHGLLTEQALHNASIT